eukprot:TRINITY_DN1254_c0_g1_i2.p1 TRINITY_DN1254_c0_g1~~TRINITY_DN1254_c0_g1_i2.p1  ORF type:complete len:1623 (+),score=211.40 TRINITY_DN1254_c0_g1_i2:4009-8877(+)
MPLPGTRPQAPQKALRLCFVLFVIAFRKAATPAVQMKRQAALVALLSIGAVLGAQMQNLVRNPSGDIDTAGSAPSNWISSPSGGTVLSRGTYVQPGVSGEKYFRVPNGTTVGELYQEIDVQPYRDGTPFTFSVWISGGNISAPDIANAILEWRTGATVYGSISSPAYPTNVSGATNLSVWWQFTAISPKPVQATTARVRLQGTRASGGFIDALFASVQFAPNLLFNPSGEDGTVTGSPAGWTTTGLPWRRTTAGPFGAVPHGARVLEATQLPLTQDINVTSYASMQPFLFAGMVSGGAVITVTFGNTTQAVIGTPVTRAAAGGWDFQPVNGSVTKPEGATFIRVALSANASIASSSYFDALWLFPNDARPRLSVTSLEFGERHPANGNAVLSTQLSNDGAFGTLDLSAVQITGAGSSLYSLQGMSTADLTPGATLTYQVTFLASPGIAAPASLTFTTGSWDLPSVTASLSGTGIDQTATINNSVALGQVHQNIGTWPSMLVILKNTGTYSSLQVLNLFVVGTSVKILAGPVDFASPHTLAPGASLQYTVQYDPTTGLGNRTATLSFTTNDPGHQQSNFTLTAENVNFALQTVPASLQFGQQHITLGQKSLVITLFNGGARGLLNVTSVQFNTTAQYSITQGAIPGTGLLLAPQQTRNITIQFDPATSGSPTVPTLSYPGLFLINSNDPNIPQASIVLTAFGSDQTASANATSIDFGVQPKKRNTTWRRILFSNNAPTGGTLVFTGITLTGHTDSFSISGGLRAPSSLERGTSTAVDIVFSPSILGQRSATLTLTTNDPTHPTFTFPISGFASDHTLAVTSPANLALAFGRWRTGNGSTASLRATIFNSGTTGNLNISSVQLVGANSADFTVTSGSSAVSISPGQSHEIDVSFQPSTVGQRAATLRVVSNDVDSPTLDIALTAEGTDEIGTPSSSSLSFPSQDTSAPAANTSLLITNTGTHGALRVISASVTGPQSADFAVTPLQILPLDLSPGSSVSLNVKYLPTGVNNRSATLVVVTSWTTLSVPLSSSAVHPVLQLSATSLFWGDWEIARGTKLVDGLAYWPVTLSNTGSTPLTVASLSLNGSSAYSISPQSISNPIPAGGSVQIQVSWNVASPDGAKVGALVITSDDYRSPQQTISLRAYATKRLGGSSVTLVPPYAGQLSTVTLQSNTTDQGLPADGALEIVFPQPFNIARAKVSINGHSIATSNVKVDSYRNSVWASVAGSGISAVTAGGTITAVISYVVLPDLQTCQSQSSLWTWNATTLDSSNGPVEILRDANLNGDFCIQAKTFNFTTDPPAAAGVIPEGATVRFSIFSQTADILSAYGLQLMDTHAGKDMAKIVRVPAACWDDADKLNVNTHTGAFFPSTADLGPTDAANQTISTFATALLQTTSPYRLCYKHADGPFGWEQVGEPFYVGARVANHTTYVYIGIPGPTSLDTSTWQDFAPRTIIAGETRTYTFTGALVYSGVPFWAKVADLDCSGNAPGTPTSGVQVATTGGAATASFRVTQPGVYRVCVKYRNDWEPTPDAIYVRSLPLDNLEPLNGFSTCQGYIENNPPRCGCFVGNGTRVMKLGTDRSIAAIVANTGSSLTVNQGCCARNSNRTIVSASPLWGYCADPLV